MDRLLNGSERYSNSRPALRETSVHGLPVSIEIEAGQTRGGVGEDGEKWERTYTVPYGEFRQSEALSDGDGVDVYVGPDRASQTVYVVHQLRRDGSYDEDKVMAQFGSARDAERAYRDHGPEWGFGSMDEMSANEFVKGYMASNRRHG